MNRNYKNILKYFLFVLIIFCTCLKTDTDPNPENLERLPTSLSESLEALDKADFLEEFIGEKLLTSIKAMRKVCI